MTPSLEDLGILRLPVNQRLVLAQEILDSVFADTVPGPLSEAKRQELKRRLEDHAAHPDDVIPLEQVQAEFQARYK